MSHQEQSSLEAKKPAKPKHKARKFNREVFAKWEADKLANPDATSVHQIQETWEKVKEYYDQSACRRAVRQILEQHRPERGWEIESAVIFGTGMPSIGYKKGRDVTLLQIAAYLDVVEYCEFSRALLLVGAEYGC